MSWLDSKRKRWWLIIPLLLILPLTLAFDAIVYLMGRSACLQCSNLLEFFKTTSLSVFLIAGSLGYKLTKKQNDRK
jgi:hypothetical protein